MKNIFYFLLLLTSFAVKAQDDPMDVLNKNTEPSTVMASAIFKSTKIINGQSIETMAKKHLNFGISHRFGAIGGSDGGFYHYYGLDQANMRLGFDYGVTDNLMIGLGLSPTNSTQKTTDVLVKYKLLRQSSGARNMPVSVAIFGGAAINGLQSTSGNSLYAPTFYNNSQRMTYCTQILIAKKFTDGFSLQITPTYLHRNKVFAIDPTSSTELIEPNDIFAIGVGGRVKISKRTSINAEYFYRLASTNTLRPLNDSYHNSLSIGFDIETGGHVFQLHFTNSVGMVENQFIAQTTDSWSKGAVHWGFNLLRTFSFEKEQKKAAW